MLSSGPYATGSVQPHALLRPRPDDAGKEVVAAAPAHRRAAERGWIHDLPPATASGALSYHERQLPSSRPREQEPMYPNAPLARDRRHGRNNRAAASCSNLAGPDLPSARVDPRQTAISYRSLVCRQSAVPIAPRWQNRPYRHAPTASYL
jgi:hypothetical protein